MQGPRPPLPPSPSTPAPGETSHRSLWSDTRLGSGWNRDPAQLGDREGALMSKSGNQAEDMVLPGDHDQATIIQMGIKICPSTKGLW